MRHAPPDRHRIIAAMLIAGAVLVAGPLRSRAAPPPTARSIPAPPGAADGLRSRSADLHVHTAADVCGTNIDAAADVMATHLARGPLTPLSTTYSVDVGEIAVLEDDGTFYYNDTAGHPILDIASAAKAFYRTHGDDYDQIAFYIGNGGSTYLGSPTALAAAFLIRNNTSGIGLGPVDIGAGMGSPSRLQGILSMNGLQKYKNGPDEIDPNYNDLITPMDLLGHEFGHRWLAYVYVDSAGEPVPALLGRDYQHWNFFADVDASIMEGSSMEQATVDSFYTDSVSVGYGGPDLYLMGLLSKAETESILVVNNPTNPLPAGIYVPYSVPFAGFRCHGVATYWHVSDIEGVHGPRVPSSATAPHAFRLAICLVVPHGVAPLAADLNKIETFRARFETYFREATRYRGTVNTAIDSQAGEVSITHAALKDRENAVAPITIGARITMARSSMGLGINPASSLVRWRFNGGSWNVAPMALAAPDSFTVTLPGPGASGAFDYVIEAASDSAAIVGRDPAAGLAAPHTMAIGPDLTPPVVAHVMVSSQGAGRLPQTLLAHVTDNLGVDSVWVEYAINAGPLQSAATGAAGRDSFSVSLGAGLTNGQTLAYRFVARDQSFAQNVATSNATFDTLRVGTNWIFDFENGAEGMTHSAGFTSYRDAWHLSQESSSPPGGTGWKCGAPDDTSDYAPHLDADLYLPPIASVPAGTLLRFDHRWVLEEGSSTRAWDGAMLEASTNGGSNWSSLATAAGYTHSLIGGIGAPFTPDTPCWSGDSQGWRFETADLTPFAGGPLRLRFRLLADDYISFKGWFVDRVRLQFPGGTLAVMDPGGSLLSVGAPYPNPARGSLSLAFALDRAADVEWALYDLQGRRVHALSGGLRPAGGGELRATLPQGLRAGLYFAQLNVGGRAVRTDRVAVVK